MDRHTEPEMARNRRDGIYQSGVLPAISSQKSVGPSPGVIANSGSPSAGIPSGELRHFDPREFVSERILQGFVLDDRPRSRRAAAAVLKRFAERHSLQVYRLGRTRIYRAEDFFHALTSESEARHDRLVRGLGS
jgi:hypothetical protein